MLIKRSGGSIIPTVSCINTHITVDLVVFPKIESHPHNRKPYALWDNESQTSRNSR
uniref:Uncharacterized protein n=1 Tax=Anguilla anguilla TaxID=7936 RepID=A0A0E9WNQ8_ANGAN